MGGQRPGDSPALRTRPRLTWRRVSERSLTTAPGALPIAACIEWIFKDEHPEFADRVRACAAAGLAGVEIHMWRAKPEAELRRALDETGLALTSMLVEPRVQLLTTEGQDALLQSVRESARRRQAPRRARAGRRLRHDDRGPRRGERSAPR